MARPPGPGRAAPARGRLGPIGGHPRPGAESFAAAETRITQLAGQGCAISAGLWLAADDAARTTFVDRDRPGARPCIVLQQANLGYSAPPPMKGYVVVEDRF